MRSREKEASVGDDELLEMRAHARLANDAGFTRVEIDPLHLCEIIDRALARRLVLAPGEPQADAPTDLALLPDYWDERRRKQGKPDLSRCAAELRIALRAKSAP
jgi:hypothetical protein